jgi:hypothetical protein
MERILLGKNSKKTDPAVLADQFFYLIEHNKQAIIRSQKFKTDSVHIFFCSSNIYLG